ncbi:hypothetical protein GGP41_001617 [Bipolaris sorokiniana]|uniref:Uncharacterized protein n=1 Tax=Cochliobolus sativus TaxID=45130 RepID=A0A8H5ZQ09_COCSA|nr:hypothetical protein GGP41_001617 [Bipolaris sorokiniana]
MYHYPISNRLEKLKEHCTALRTDHLWRSTIVLFRLAPTNCTATKPSNLLYPLELRQGRLGYRLDVCDAYRLKAQLSDRGLGGSLLGSGLTFYGGLMNVSSLEQG